MKSRALYCTWIYAAMVILAHLVHKGSATYSVFIARSELERYYRGTSNEDSILGFSVDIIRDGVSLILEDGSLALIPHDGPRPGINSTTLLVGATTSEFLTIAASRPSLTLSLTSAATPVTSKTSPEPSSGPSIGVVTALTSEVPVKTSTGGPTHVSSTGIVTEDPISSSTESSAPIPSTGAPVTISTTEVLMLSSTGAPTEVSTTEIHVGVSSESPTSTDSPTEIIDTILTTAQVSSSTLVTPDTSISSSTPVHLVVSSSVPSEITSSRVSNPVTDFTATVPTVSMDPSMSVSPTMLPTPSSAEDATSTVVSLSSEVLEESGSGSGSGIGFGMNPPGSLRKKRQSASSSSLPPLPSHIDEVAFSWIANSTVNYELSLSMAPMGHFSELLPNVSSMGVIPQDQSGFSVRFPCSPGVSGLGVLFINLTTTITSPSSMIQPDNITMTTFNIQKNCQAASFSPVPTATVSSPFPSILLTTPISAQSVTPISTFTYEHSSSMTSFFIPLTSSSPGSGKTTTSSSEGSAAESPFVKLLLLVFAPVVGVLVLSIIIVCCSVCICCCCCRKKSKSHYSDDPSELPMNALSRDDFLYPVPLDLVVEKKEEVPISLWMALPWGSVANLSAGIQGVIKRYAVDRRSLSILTTVSRGDFGCIVNGQLSLDRTDPVGGSKGVMMKMYIGFQKQYGHRDEITKFLECGTLLRGIDHPNIHSVMRVSVEDNYVPIIIYPIVEYGNLHQFMTLCRVTPADSPLSPVTIEYKVSFAFQIACGMKHLSEKGIVHPDLALRNCLLDTSYQVKITDGALSQFFHPECYNTVRGTIRPVRWAAIETLQEGLCTSQSNVWSYGITVWEVMTLAKLPYSTKLDHDRGVVSHLLMDNRLPQPEDCPDTIYSLMLDCWKKRAEDRPNFSTIHATIFEMHSKHSAVQSAASTSGNDTTYSTFGKNIKPQISVTETTGFPNQRRKRSSLIRLSRNSSMTSQRNNYLGPDTPGLNHLGLDAPSQDGVSLTFSVLSDENYLNQASDSEDEVEGTEINIPMFLTGNSNEDLSQLPQQPAPIEHPHEEYPVESVSTFLPSSKPSVNHTELPYGTSSFHPPGPPVQRRPPKPLLKPAPKPPPTTISPLVSRSHCTTPTDASSKRNETDGSRPLSDLIHQDAAAAAAVVNAPSLAVQSDVDTVSKASTLDSVGTFVSGPQPSQISSHIPGIPGSTYNSTSVTIDDVKLRNKSLLSANGQTSFSAVSGTPSGTSKSDSGIRSDEEADLVLSGSGPPVPPPVAPKRASIGNRMSAGGRGSLGLGDFSKDLMSTFASWDDK